MYRNLSTVVFVVTLAVWLPLMADDSCNCPALACDPMCENETDVTFYSDKCEGGAKVKSCARPTCVKKDPFPAACQRQEALNEASKTERSVAASTEEVIVPAKKVGIVEAMVKQSWRVPSSGEPVALVLGDIVNETETVKTGSKSRLEIRFDDGNLITLSENTTVKLTEVVVSEDAHKRSATLDLMSGKVRSRVKKTYKGAHKGFQVRTPGAVAGVRGTEFVVELLNDEGKDERVTQVSTFTGIVELRGKDRPDKVLVGKEERAAFVEKGFSARMDGEDFLQKAYLTPVSQLAVSEKRRLDRETLIQGRAVASRGVASSDLAAICDKPRGEFNQCAWKCVGNPSGASTCRTDLPEVSCERRVCKADGQWHDLTRMPSSEGHFCEPVKEVVGPCNY